MFLVETDSVIIKEEKTLNAAKMAIKVYCKTLPI